MAVRDDPRLAAARAGPLRPDDVARLTVLANKALPLIFAGNPGKILTGKSKSDRKEGAP